MAGTAFATPVEQNRPLTWVVLNNLSLQMSAN